MEEERKVASWFLKPCSDGISIDVRPPKRYQIDLKSLNLEGFRAEIVSSSIAILYSSNNIKITIYQSGRMLIETRDMDVAEAIFNEILNYFNLI